MTSIDLILTNGTVWAGSGRPPGRALAIGEGKIVAVGQDDEIRSLAARKAVEIDLAGRLATPGFIDSHIHLLAFGFSMLDLGLRDTRRLDDLLAAIRERAAAVGPGKWIKGTGHDEGLLDVHRHPSREELDAVAPDNPVYLARTCGHVYVCNSLALELSGIREDMAIPPGAVIERTDGRLTGVIAETARDLVKRSVPARTMEEFATALQRGSRFLASQGVTGVMEAGVGRLTADYGEFETFIRASRDGSLSLRVCMGITGGDNGLIRKVVDQGYRHGDGNELAWIGPVKFHLDGSAGGRTAAMSEPYFGTDGACGDLILEDDYLFAAVREWHEEGFQIAVHAIGDRAIEQVLRTLEEIDRTSPVRGRRHRIEHCGFPRADQIERMSRLGIVPSPQPIFVYQFGDTYTEIVGSERSAAAYPMRAWLDSGLPAAAGTDAPVCIPETMMNMYAMLTRRTRSGNDVGPGQRLNVDEALSAYTRAGAFAQFKEARRGLLAPGMDADIAIFSEDFTAAESAATVRRAVCDLTLLGGRLTHDRLGEAGAARCVRMTRCAER